MHVAEKATIYEVARLSGVSTATVSRVMRDRAGFSTDTRARVLASASKLGWVPSGTARGLASRRVGIVGLLFPDLGLSEDADEESPLYVDQVIRGAERAATAAGDAILIAATHGMGGREVAHSVAGKVDGLVVMARSLPEKQLTALARSIPVVVLADHRAPRHLDFVAADNRGGSREVTRHLVTEHGHRSLAFIGGPARSPDSMERFAGFCEALAAAGLPVPSEPDAEGGFTECGGERGMRMVLESRKQPPQAVVLGNDQMAIGALAALRSARLRVPHDVAVTGFDDLSSARYVRPALTTVRQPMRDLGEESVRALLDRISYPGSPRRHVILPTRVVVRRSCGCRAKRTPARRGSTT